MQDLRLEIVQLRLQVDAQRREIERLEAENARLQADLREANDWLGAAVGSLVQGDALQERIESVVRHYATQLGRWAGQGRKQKR